MPTTIFDFPPVLDQIVTNTQNLLDEFADIINKLNASLGNENQIINNQSVVEVQLVSINTQLTAFNTNLNNVINLMEAIIQGLGGVATLANQTQIITLLNNLLSLPDHIVLDIRNAVARKQVVPVKKGP